jgi:dolichol kinase
MTFGDPIGFYVGRTWGKHRLYNTKSLEGMGAVFVVSWVVLVALLLGAGIGWAVPLLALLPALLATLGEGLAPRHLDNLLMTLGSLGGWLLAVAIVGL